MHKICCENQQQRMERICTKFAGKINSKECSSTVFVFDWFVLDMKYGTSNNLVCPANELCLLISKSEYVWRRIESPRRRPPCIVPRKEALDAKWLVERDNQWLYALAIPEWIACLSPLTFIHAETRFRTWSDIGFSETVPVALSKTSLKQSFHLDMENNTFTSCPFLLWSSDSLRQTWKSSVNFSSPSSFPLVPKVESATSAIHIRMIYMNQNHSSTTMSLRVIMRRNEKARFTQGEICLCFPRFRPTGSSSPPSKRSSRLTTSLSGTTALFAALHLSRLSKARCSK